MSQVLGFTKQITLAAGVAQNVDIRLNGATKVCGAVKNTGSNAIGTVKVYKVPNDVGGIVVEDSGGETALGASIAAGATSGILEYASAGFGVLRIALTSSSGSTATIEFSGND